MRGLTKEKSGTVVSDKMQKTVVVRVNSRVEHPKYKKTIVRSANFKAHVPKDDCKVGDKVIIVETRPVSKDKRWRVKKIIKKAKTLH